MQLSDIEIKRLSETAGMISPCYPTTSGNGIIGYGLTSYGYDARLSNVFAMCKNSSSIIDPKEITPADFYPFENDNPFCIPPRGFLLAATTETFKIPRDILVICVGRSTYARCGLGISVTPLEPEWEGVVTLELSNLTGSPIMIYPHQGICQFIFLRSNIVCETSYADKKGKYQGQTGVTLARVSK